VIRISEIRKGSKRRLLVEGTLSGDWVEVLEKSWLEAQTSRNGEPMRIDLSVADKSGAGYVRDRLVTSCVRARRAARSSDAP
jgi:hypothetical protein